MDNYGEMLIYQTEDGLTKIGMTVEQVAERMDVPVDYVKGCLES